MPCNDCIVQRNKTLSDELLQLRNTHSRVVDEKKGVELRLDEVSQALRAATADFRERQERSRRSMRAQEQARRQVLSHMQDVLRDASKVAHKARNEAEVELQKLQHDLSLAVQRVPFLHQREIKAVADHLDQESEKVVLALKAQHTQAEGDFS